MKKLIKTAQDLIDMRKAELLNDDKDVIPPFLGRGLGRKYYC